MSVLAPGLLWMVRLTQNCVEMMTSLQLTTFVHYNALVFIDNCAFKHDSKVE
jgi:hypothetical protein